MSTAELIFENQIELTLEHIKGLLIQKGREYRRNNNPFHNFERGAEISGRSREEVLQGFLLKHLISVEDLRNDSKRGDFPDVSKIHEKYNDILVYFLIEKIMMLDNVEEYSKKLSSARL